MRTKRKILHLIPTLERGGSEMSQLRMLPFLNDTLDSVFVTLRQEGSLAERFRSQNIPVIALNQRGFWDLAAYWHLAVLLRKTAPDLVITHLLYADMVGRFFTQWFVRCRVVSSLATTYNFPSYWPARLFERVSHSLSSGYIANAEIVKKTYVERFGVPEHKIAVLTTGMDIATFRSIVPDPALRQALAIADTDIVLICVANLHINKGHRYLLEAFERMAASRSDMKLLLVGDGEERQNLENQCKGYRSQSAIHFLGKRSDVPQLLAISHIFVLPTFFEGMCNAIMEAMSTGLPVITTDIPENRELVTHDSDGLLCQVRDTSSLAASLEQLVCDPDRRKQMGEAARRSMEARYNLPDSVKRWRTLLLALSQP